LGGKGVANLPHLHRPWIDDIRILCPGCGKEVSRIPEVGDVWLDAGIVPFSTLWYFEDREKWQNYFPIEWITEMREQVRLWFYSMLFMSVTLTGRAPYEHVIAYASVISETGAKFSKTGNMIRFDEAAEKIGADVIRYLYANSGIANDVRFGFNLGEEVRRKLLRFWNIYVFFETYVAFESNDFLNVEKNNLEEADKWLNARVNSFVAKVKESYEAYNSQGVIDEFELCVDDISNWYIRTNRKRFWRGDKGAFFSLYNAIKRLIVTMAPVIPFMSEFIWQKLVRRLEPSALLSVHLNDFEGTLELSKKELQLLEDTKLIRKVITLALKARNEKQIKVRQPLAKLCVMTSSKEQRQLIAAAKQVIVDEVNIKEIEFLENIDSLVTNQLSLDFKKAGEFFKEKLPMLKNALDKASTDELNTALKLVMDGKDVKLNGFTESVPAAMFTIKTKVNDGFHLVEEKDIAVAVDIRVSEELMREGIYRELLRNCQVLRKEAGFKVEQRIHLCISSGDSKINSVIEEYKDKLASELLAVKFGDKLECMQLERTININGCEILVQMNGRQ
jgi:isoleucyl-tRNA synthetase